MCLLLMMYYSVLWFLLLPFLRVFNGLNYVTVTLLVTVSLLISLKKIELKQLNIVDKINGGITNETRMLIGFGNQLR